MGGIRSVSLVSWQGVLKPGRFSAPLHVVDWMPTLCNLAGYKPARDMKWDGLNV
jgi:arylsulfatase A-like enzyme